MDMPPPCTPGIPGETVPPPDGMCTPLAAGGAVGPLGEGKPPPPLLTPPAAGRGRSPPAPWKPAELARPLPLLDAPAAGCGGGVPAPSPPRLEPPAPCGAEPRSCSLIGFGASASPRLKPFARAQLRASPPCPSAPRILCVDDIILSTASRLAFAPSALHRACTACISVSFSGGSFFDARISLISLLPVFAMSDNRLRR